MSDNGVMRKTLQDFTPVFQAVIAFVAIMTALGLLFSYQLKPIYARLDGLEQRIDRLEQRMDGLEKGLAEIKRILQDNYARNPRRPSSEE